MSSKLRLLCIEDSETDAKLIERTLRNAGLRIEGERVDETAALTAALSRRVWDLILSDWVMPRLRGRAALSMVKAAQPDTPLIIVSSTAGEDNAVEAMRAGAHDFILKSNLARLPSVVERELNESRARAAHRRAQEALRESEARYRVLFENSPLPKWLYDVKTLRFLAVNGAAINSYGYSQAEFLRMSIKDIIPPEDGEAIAYEPHGLTLGLHPPGAHRHKKKDGTLIDVEVTGHTFPLEGRVARLVVAHDVTERRRSDNALRASEERMRLLLDSTAEGIYAIDLNDNCTLANAAGLGMLGYSEERALLGKSMHRLTHHTRADGTSYPLEECRIYQSGATDDGATIDGEILWRADGSNFPADLRSFPLRRNGIRVGTVVSFVDTTIRKKAEETTRWLAAIVQASSEAIIGTDAQGAINSWNPGAERLYGYTATEALGRPFSILYAETHGEISASMFRKALAGEVVRDFETVGVRKNGSHVDVSLSLSPIWDAEGPVRGVSGVSRDITDRRAAQEQVRLLHHILSAAGEAVTLDETLDVVLRMICQATGIPLANAWVHGTDGRAERRGRWTRPNDRALFARFLEEWSFDNLVSRVWASKHPAWIANLAMVASPGCAEIAAELGVRAGAAVPILVGEELVAVIEVFLPQPRHENANLVALLSAVGAQIGSVIRRRRAEEALRRSEEQLRQANKMEAIGQLMGGIAHDFNNVLSVILSYSALLVDEIAPLDPRLEEAQEILNAGRRAAALTQQLLAFSRRQVLQPRVMDLNQIVAVLERMLRRLIGEDIELTVIPAGSPAKVHVDPGQIDQVIMNLAINARDAMPTGGKLTLQVANVALDDGFASEHSGVSAGPHVMLAVTDTGCGMDAMTQARAFEPFFTTKEKGKGTGLGLSTVFGIIHQSAGTIWLYSELGEGTTFKIYLPTAEADPVQTVVPLPTVGSLQGSEVILLLEDEDGVRKLIRTILERNGYRVVEAKDGIEALRIAEKHPRIDLLLTDVVVPHLSGTDTAARLVALRPALRVLYMSGYTDSAVVLQGLLRSESAFLQKPISPPALLAKVREVLDSPPALTEDTKPE